MSNNTNTRGIDSYPLILAELRKNQWAMNYKSFEAMIQVIDDKEIDPFVMHRVEPEEMQALTAYLGEHVEGTRRARRRENVGILSAYGPMIPRSSWLESSGMVSVESLASDLRVLQNDRSIDKILMLYDTPGGSVTGVSELSEMIRSSNKEIVGHIIGMADSAGYWAISQSSRVTSVNTGVAGSIGVVATIMDTSEHDEKKGIKKMDILSTNAPRKRTDLTTVEGRTELQAILDGIEDVFLTDVAKGRKVSKQDVIDRYGQGGDFVASEALQRGMIDEIISTESLLNSMVDNKSSLFGVTAKKKESKMAKPNNTENNAVTPHQVDIDAEKESAKAEAIQRLKDIESIKGEFKDYPQDVKSAVSDLVDDKKFSDKETVESIRNAAKDKALEIQGQMLNKMRSAGSELNERLSNMPVSGQKESEEDAKASRIKNMIAGYKAAGRETERMN